MRKEITNYTKKEIDDKCYHQCREKLYSTLIFTTIGMLFSNPDIEMLRTWPNIHNPLLLNRNYEYTKS